MTGMPYIWYASCIDWSLNIDKLGQRLLKPNSKPVRGLCLTREQAYSGNEIDPSLDWPNKQSQFLIYARRGWWEVRYHIADYAENFQ